MQCRRGQARARVRAAGAALSLVVALLLSAGCSGGSGVTLPSITATPSRTSSGDGQALPSITKPSAEPSRSRESASASRDSTPEQSAPEQPAPEQPTPEQSSEQSQVPPTVVVVSPRESTAASQGSADAVVSATPSAASASTTTDDDSTLGWPLWVLVALVVVAVGVVIALVQHRSRRKDERSSFEAALSESLWLGRDLTPALLGDSRDERRGAWSVARPRVVALEDRLARLASPGSESIDSLNAQHLETAVIGLRRALDAESQPGDPGPDAAAEAIGGVKQAALQLEQVLSAVAPTPAPPG
jgi:hypothetical protein